MLSDRSVWRPIASSTEGYWLLPHKLTLPAGAPMHVRRRQRVPSGSRCQSRYPVWAGWGSQSLASQALRSSPMKSPLGQMQQDSDGRIQLPFWSDQATKSSKASGHRIRWRFGPRCFRRGRGYWAHERYPYNIANQSTLIVD